MPEVIKADHAHIPAIIEIAEITWATTYATLLTPEAMRYMLDSLYNANELRRVMSDGSQNFLILKDHHGCQGFAAYGIRKEDTAVFKLHKIYVLPGNQGKGYGRLLIDEVKKQVRDQGGTTLDLNVNRQNPAQGFYKKLGFKIIRQEDVPVGPYFMNDYVMRLELRGF